MIYKTLEHLSLPGLTLESNKEDSQLKLELQMKPLEFPTGSQADLVQGSLHGIAYRQEPRFVKRNDND